MIKPKIKDYELQFSRPLDAICAVNKIVVHHTGNPYDDNLSAEELHESHLGNGWAGIGYHYVIRKDGTIEKGRPEWAVGAHAEGFNRESIGVQLCGNFELVDPTPEQIESAAYLIGWLCEKYCLVPDAGHVVGHRDLMATACPGERLYEMMQTIRGKAIWYQQNYKEGD